MSIQKSTDQPDDERAEREEMFGFHPEILAEAGDLPRKSDPAGYTSPDADGQERP